MGFSTEACVMQLSRYVFHPTISQKVLGIEQPIERRQKPELLNKGQCCYLFLEEINGQPDYKANKDKLNNKVKQSAFLARIPLASNTSVQLVIGALRDLTTDFTF